MVEICLGEGFARYPEFMSTQQTDVSDLAVLAGSQQQWAPGTPKDGVDDRVELARISAAAQSRGPRRPISDRPGPAVRAARLAGPDRRTRPDRSALGRPPAADR